MSHVPLDFIKWINENRCLLVSPVSNKLVMSGKDFFIMAVGGPNERSDYHINPTEEWFYQLRGDMLLKVIGGANGEDLVFEDVWIKEGNMLLLPAGVPHNPVRFVDTLGIVVERTRVRGEHTDRLCWYCQQCKDMVHEESFFLENAQVQLREAIEKYAGSEALRTCKSCSFINSAK